VTGISQDGNTNALEAALKAAGLALDPIQLIGPDDSTQGAASRGGIIGSGGIMAAGPAPACPASPAATPPRADRNRVLSERDAQRSARRPRDPDDEVENYVDALENGRSVVAYFAKPETIDKVSEIFHASGLTKVKTF